MYLLFASLKGSKDKSWSKETKIETPPPKKKENLLKPPQVKCIDAYNFDRLVMAFFFCCTVLFLIEVLLFLLSMFFCYCRSSESLRFF